MPLASADVDPWQAGGESGDILYFRPHTVNEAVQLLAHRDVQLLAGGTDFYPALGENPPRKPIVDVSCLGELRGIASHSDHIRIGGLTTWTDIIRTPLPRCFEMLKDAAREVGSVQIQNCATIAGNLCNASPAADGVPPLLAMDASIELLSAAGSRRLPLAEFITGNRKTKRRPDELLTGISVPQSLANADSAFQKLGARRYLVISITSLAVAILSNGAGRVVDARVAVGSCSAVAQRLPALEQELLGAAVHDDLAARVRPEHLAPLSPISDIRATAEYRLDSSMTLVRRTIARCVEGH